MSKKRFVYGMYDGEDWFDDGDEFEVCKKGNDVSEGICREWEEL